MNVVLQRFQALGVRAAMLICLAGSAATAEGTAYQNSVHIDKNNGTVTINNNTYPVRPGVTEEAIRQLVDAAQQKAGANWRASFQKALGALNAQAEARHTETITKLETIHTGIGEVKAQLEAANDQNSGEGAKQAATLQRELDGLKAQQQAILEALLKKRPPPPPNYTWLWISGIAAVIGGGIVATIVLTRESPPERQISPGTLGIVRLRLGEQP